MSATFFVFESLVSPLYGLNCCTYTDWAICDKTASTWGHCFHCWPWWQHSTAPGSIERVCGSWEESAGPWCKDYGQEQWEANSTPVGYHEQSQWLCCIDDKDHGTIKVRRSQCTSYSKGNAKIDDDHNVICCRVRHLFMGSLDLPCTISLHDLLVKPGMKVGYSTSTN